MLNDAIGRALTRPCWIPVFAVLVAGHILVSVLTLPSSIEATLARLPASADAADRQAVVAMLEQEQIIRSVFFPIRLGIALGVYALWVVFLCRVFSRDVVPRYRIILGLVVYAEVFVLLARAAALARCHWWPSGDPARDLLPPFSLADLLPLASDHLAVVAASFMNPFSALSVVTLGLGLCVSCRFRPGKGYVLALIAWTGGAVGSLALLYAARTLLHGAP